MVTGGLQLAGHGAELNHQELGDIVGREIRQVAGDPGIAHPIPQPPQRIAF
jgi:hypothetical protein